MDEMLGMNWKGFRVRLWAQTKLLLILPLVSALTPAEGPSEWADECCRLFFFGGGSTKTCAHSERYPSMSGVAGGCWETGPNARKEKVGFRRVGSSCKVQPSGFMVALQCPPTPLGTPKPGVSELVYSQALQSQAVTSSWSLAGSELS